MNTSSFKNHGIALAVIIIAVIIFCFPAFQGKILNSHDFVSWQYMSNESKTVTDAQDGNAYWTNAQFGGLPSFTTYGTHTGNWLAEFQFSFLGGLLKRPIWIMLIAALGFYIMACAFRFSLALRILLALAGAFSTYNPVLAAAGHDTKLLAIGTSAGVIGGIFYLLQGRKWLGFGIYTLFFGLMFTSGHYQVIYYLFIALGILGIFALVNAVKNGTASKLIMPVVFVLLGSAIGAMPALQQVLLVRDYTDATMRGGKSELTINKKDKVKKPSSGLDIEYAFKWSQGIGETFSLLVPNVMGPMGQEKYVNGATSEKLSELGMDPNLANQLPDYWGPQPF